MSEFEFNPLSGKFEISNPPGETAKRLETTFVAGESVSALKLIYSGDAQARAYLGNSDVEPASFISGLALTSGAEDETIRVLTFGLVEDAFFSAASNTVYYLNNLGSASTIVPTSGFLVRLGWTLRPGLFFLKIEQPITL